MINKIELDLITNPKLQRLFNEKYGSWEDGDRYIYDGVIGTMCLDCLEEGMYCSSVVKDLNHNTLIRFPDIISKDGREERGLIGMIEGFSSLGKTFHKWVVRTDMESFMGKTMMEVCLKALLFQVEQSYLINKRCKK